MITLLFIKEFQHIENLRIDFENESPIITPEKKYWNEFEKNYIARSAVLYGSQASGKTMIYNCINYIYQISQCPNEILYCNADITIEFIYENNKYRYNITTNTKGIIKQKFDRLPSLFSENNKNSSKYLSKIGPWIQKLKFIESSYEVPQSDVEYIQTIESNIEEINQIINKYTNYIYWFDIDYPVFSLTHDKPGNLMLQMSGKTVNINELPKSTLELLSLLPTINDIINNNTTQILIVDDMFYVAKSRFFKIISDEFLNRLHLMTNKQLISFVYETEAKYFHHSKKINLENLSKEYHL